ncbi:hypothetical protein BLNAU_11352 [Blattamonas nauphoetae]|uniref:Tyrosine specific protein phosphatases domain-containing protein n=1 Tax=Blattamonas nauphoetae TaxID=2049346 RepID=A0ABQ9XML4_9EUKA|nr:hypothetical protein BLNAU_11352 [Blattamonas nauphoetae]
MNHFPNRRTQTILSPESSEIVLLCGLCVSSLQRDRTSIKGLLPPPATVALIIPVDTVTPDYFLSLYENGRIIHTKPYKAYELITGKDDIHSSLLLKAETAFRNKQNRFQQIYQDFKTGSNRDTLTEIAQLSSFDEAPKALSSTSVSFTKFYQPPTSKIQPNSSQQNQQFENRTIPSSIQASFRASSVAKRDIDAQTEIEPIENPCLANRFHPSFRSTFRGPTPTSNWIIPGRLLMSSYPASSDDIERQLLAGVTVWVDLTQNGEGGRFGEEISHFEYFDRAVKTVRMEQLLRIRALMEKDKLEEIELNAHQKHQAKLQSQERALIVKRISEPMRTKELKKLRKREERYQHRLHPTPSEKILVPPIRFHQHLDSLLRIRFPIPRGFVGREDETLMLVDYLAGLIHLDKSDRQVICVHSWDGKDRAALISSLVVARLFRLSGMSILDSIQHFYQTRPQFSSNTPPLSQSFYSNSHTPPTSHHIPSIPSSHHQKAQIYALTKKWSEENPVFDYTASQQFCLRFVERTGVDLLRHFSLSKVDDISPIISNSSTKAPEKKDNTLTKTKYLPKTSPTIKKQRSRSENSKSNRIKRKPTTSK